VLAVAAFVLLAFSPRGFAQEGAATRAAEAMVERQWARQHLIDAVISGFRALAKQRTAGYETFKSHKAGAACVQWPKAGGDAEPYTRFWGGAWEYHTADQASRAAMTQCEKARTNALPGPDCACELLYSDDAVVLKPPAEAVAASIVRLRRSVVPTMCSAWFGHDNAPLIDWSQVSVKSCPGYSIETVDRLEFIINHIPYFAWPMDAPDIFPAAPVARQSDISARHLTSKSDGRPLDASIRFDLPEGDDYIGTWTTPFTLPEHWTYRFKLHRVPTGRTQRVLALLKGLEHSKMYGRFRPLLRAGVTLPYLNPSDEFARYTRAYDLSDHEVRDAMDLDPENSYDGLLHGERSTRLWVEGTIPVDKNWTPVGQPLRSVTPIAVQTDRAIYLYSVEVVPQRGGAGTVGHFEGRALDLSGCTGSSSCIQNAVEALVEELTRAFEQAPLSAAPVRNRLMPPSQVRLQRITEESVVLQGFAGPYYEMSTYTATFWPGPRDGFVGTAELYFSWQDDPAKSVGRADQLFLQVEQTLQISVSRKGSYEEPTADQYAAYDRAVNTAVQSAIAQATTRLGGKVGPDGVGVVPPEKATVQ
jgi:hypothetical protein